MKLSKRQLIKIKNTKNIQSIDDIYLYDKILEHNKSTPYE